MRHFVNPPLDSTLKIEGEGRTEAKQVSWGWSSQQDIGEDDTWCPLLFAQTPNNLVPHSKFISVHGSTGLGSYGHHLPALASTAEEGPVWPPHHAAVLQEVTGTLAAKYRHKGPGFTKVSAQSGCGAWTCNSKVPGVLLIPLQTRGEGVWGSLQSQRCQEDKVLGPRDESMADCSGHD